jgi:hypothetical protein
MVLLPGRLEPGDGRGREVRGVGAEDRLQGLGEAACADPLQVEPGDQLLQAPGAAEVGRQDGGGELLPLARRSPIVDPRLLDFDVAESGLDGASGEVAVADDLLATGVVLVVGVGVDVGGDLGLDGLGQHPPGPVPEQVGQDVVARRQGHDADVGGRLAHGGILLGLVGQMVCS